MKNAFCGHCVIKTPMDHGLGNQLGKKLKECRLEG